MNQPHRSAELVKQQDEQISKSSWRRLVRPYRLKTGSTLPRRLMVVLMTRVQGTSAAIETKFLSKPIIAEPGTACTETYLVAWHFSTQPEAVRFAKYLSTRFVRFLVSLRKPTQYAARGIYAFVPELPVHLELSDATLFKRYGLTQDEIGFIESQVAEHDSELFDEVDTADNSDD